MVLAILSHGVDTGVPRDNLLRKTSFVCDEVTGLITAVALIRLSRSILDLKVSSVKKKWRNKNFAAGTNHEEMEQVTQDDGAVHPQAAGKLCCLGQPFRMIDQEHFNLGEVHAFIFNTGYSLYLTG